MGKVNCLYYLMELATKPERVQNAAPSGLAEAVAENRQLRNIFRALFDSPYEPTIITDSEGRIVYINRFYAAYLGYEVAEIIGRPAGEVIENSRMHLVCKTLEPDIGVIMRIKGRELLVSRLPLFDGKKPVGVFAKGIFLETLKKSLIDNPQAMQFFSRERLKGLAANQPRYTLDDIIAYSPAMQALKEALRTIAGSDSTVLVVGETGVGKELFAHSIHQLSDRKHQPFVKVNCAAIPEQLLESELFGYEEGAFTGAKKGGKIGKFELAGRGTIFLDEIGDMPAGMQVKLLRVLQECEVERVGGSHPIPVAARVVAATNQPLAELVKKGRLRKDLFYRLNRVTLVIPPLRERKEEIMPLFGHFVASVSAQLNRPLKRVSAKAATYLTAYDWPGNVRELEGVVENIMHSVDAATIEVRHLSEILPSTHETVDTLKDKLRQTQDELLKAALQTCRQNKTEAARLLGLSRATLYRSLQEKATVKSNE
jgi:transcriptional regulator with PAS, ATPase and Fis domain